MKNYCTAYGRGILMFFFALFSISLCDAARLPVELWRDGVRTYYTSIQAAINAARAGDIIRVRGGMYYENLVINQKSGSPSAPIRLEGAPGETVIIDGADQELQQPGNNRWTDIGSGTFHAAVPFRGDTTCNRSTAASIGSEDSLLATYYQPSKFDSLSRGRGIWRHGSTVKIRLNGGGNPGSQRISIGTSDAIIRISNASDWVICNLVLAHSGYAGIWLSGSNISHIILDRLTISTVYRGITTDETGSGNNIFIRNCHLINHMPRSWSWEGYNDSESSTDDRRSGQRSTGVAIKGAADCEISNCRIEGFWDGMKLAGIRNKAFSNIFNNLMDDMVELESSYSDDVRFYNNYGYDLNSGISVGNNIGGNVYVFRNRVVNTRLIYDLNGENNYGYCIKIGGSSPQWKAENIKFYNNSFYGYRGEIWDSRRDTLKGVEFVNNIFMTGPDYKKFNFVNQDTLTHTFANGCFWSHNLWNKEKTISENGIVRGDPGYVSVQYTDCRNSLNLDITPGSIARDAGTNYPVQQGWPESVIAFAGPVDIGAQELNTDAPSAPAAGPDTSSFYSIVAMRATQDAYISGDTNASLAFGVLDSLKLITKQTSAAKHRANRRSLLSFDLTDNLYGNIYSAWLGLTGRLEHEDDSIKVWVYGISKAEASWSEKQVTWNTQPKWQPVPLDSIYVKGTIDKLYEWNVTKYIYGKKDSGQAIASFMLISDTSSRGVRILWHSDESNIARPKLKLIKPSTIIPFFEDDISGLYAVQDAYVAGDENSVTPFGLADSLNLVCKSTNVSNHNANRYSYLSFDISDTLNRYIGSSMLRLFGRLDHIDDSVKVYVFGIPNAGTGWTENTLTWDNKPAYFLRPLDSVYVKGIIPDYYVWDVSRYIQSRQDSNYTVASFALISAPSAGGARILYNSDECASRRPKLLLSRTDSTIALPQDKVPGIRAVQDAYVAGGINATLVYGLTDSMNLICKMTGVVNHRANRRSYLSFDITDSLNRYISSGRLRMNGRLEKPDDSVKVYVYGIPDKGAYWSEATLTWNNKSAFYGVPLDSVYVKGTRAAYYEWDVSRFIHSRQDSNLTRASFVLVSIPSPKGTRILWKSAECPLKWPRLVVTKTDSTIALPEDKVPGLRAVEDAYVTGGVNALIPYGITDSLNLITKMTGVPNHSANRITYLLFDVSAMPGRQITAARIRLNGRLENPDEPVKVYVYGLALAKTYWDENTINWSNKPAYLPDPLDSVYVTGTEPAYYEFNVTGYIQSWLDMDYALASFVLISVPSKAGTRILWKSSECPIKWPRLVLEGPELRSASAEDTVSIASAEDDLIFYPNPSAGLLCIRSDSEILRPVEIVLLNMSGQNVFLLQMIGKEEKNGIYLDLHALETGLYSLRIQTGAGLFMRPVLITK